MLHSMNESIQILIKQSQKREINFHLIKERMSVFSTQLMNKKAEIMNLEARSKDAKWLKNLLSDALSNALLKLKKYESGKFILIFIN